MFSLGLILYTVLTSNVLFLWEIYFLNQVRKEYRHALIKMLSFACGYPPILVQTQPVLYGPNNPVCTHCGF
jgi:hypothetical protein